MRIDDKIRFTRKLVLQLLARGRSRIVDFKVQDSKVDIRFTMTGMSAGCAGRKQGQYYVNFNRRLMNDDDNWQDYVQETIAHEVSHVIAFAVAAHHKTKYPPHGKQWKYIMKTLGYTPSRTHDYDVSAAQNKATRTWNYKCECNTYKLSRVNHKKIVMGEPRTCPICDCELRLAKD